MSELREKCKVRLAELNKLLKLDVKNSEISGATAQELPILHQLYASYTDTMRPILAAWPQPVSIIDPSQLLKSITDQRQYLTTIAAQLRGFQTFADCNNRMEKLEKVFAFVEQFARYGASWMHLRYFAERFDSVISEDALSEKEEYPTVELLRQLIDANAEGFAEVIEYASLLQQIATTSKEAELLLSKPIPHRAVEHVGSVLDVDAANDLILETKALARKLLELRNEVVCEPEEAEGLQTRLMTCIELFQTWQQCMIESKHLNDLSEDESAGKSLERFAMDRERADRAVSNAASFAASGSRATLGAMVSDAKRYLTPLQKALEILKSIRSGIESVIVKARRDVPQLYLLSDIEILQFLGSCTAENVGALEHFLVRLFPGWQHVKTEGYKITAIVGEEGEELSLPKPVLMEGEASTWIGQLNTESRCAMKKQLTEALTMVHRVGLGISILNIDELLPFTTQVGLVALHFLWTTLVEGSFSAHSGGEAASPTAVTTEHLGARAARSPPRPTSAAASRLGSLTKPTAPTAGRRPGSATGQPQSRPAKGAPKDEKVSKARPISADSRTAVAHHARETPGADSEAWLEGQGAPRQCGIRARNVSGTGKARTTKVLNQVVTQLQRVQQREGIDDVNRRKVEAWLVFFHRLRRTWEQQLKDLASPMDYRWKREPRCYFDVKTHSIFFEMSSLRIEHQLQFHGRNPPFVLTPEHVETWSSIGAAFLVDRGALLTSEASDGKTSTVLALAALCGVNVMTMNDLSSGVTYDQVQRRVAAAAASGTWVLLRHLHTASPDVQCLMARFVGACLASRRHGSTTVDIDGASVPLLKSCQFFATAPSPTDVSDSVRNVFRTCNLEKPSMHFIFEAMLSGNGFREVERFADKLRSIAEIVAPQLSATPPRRLFGVQACVSLCQFAGALLSHRAALTELHLIARAVHEFLLPRVDVSERRLLAKFANEICEDVQFSESFGQLTVAVNRQLAAKGLVQSSEETTGTVMKCYGWAVATRSCKPILLIGPSGCGKSTILNQVVELASKTNEQPEPRVIHLRSVIDATKVLEADGGVIQTINLARKRNTRVWVVFHGGVSAQIARWCTSLYVQQNGVQIFVEATSLNALPDTLVNASHIANLSVASSEAAAAALVALTPKFPMVLTSNLRDMLSHTFIPHFEEIFAFADVTSNSKRDVTHYTMAYRSLGLVVATLNSIPSRDAVVVERAFWFGATWGAVITPTAEWDALVASRMSDEGKHTQISNVTLQADGQFTTWANKACTMHAESGLVRTTDLARMTTIAKLFTTFTNGVAIVGGRGLGKSTTVRALATEEGFSIAEAADNNSVAESLTKALSVKGHKPALVIDGFEKRLLRPHDVDVIAALFSPTRHPIQAVDGIPMHLKIVLVADHLCSVDHHALPDAIATVVARPGLSHDTLELIAKESSLTTSATLVVDALLAVDKVLQSIGAPALHPSQAIELIRQFAGFESEPSPRDVARHIYSSLQHRFTSSTHEAIKKCVETACGEEFDLDEDDVQLPSNQRRTATRTKMSEAIDLLVTNNLSKKFAVPRFARFVELFGLAVSAGSSIIALIGPSGCGQDDLVMAASEMAGVTCNPLTNGKEAAEYYCSNAISRSKELVLISDGAGIEPAAWLHMADFIKTSAATKRPIPPLVVTVRSLEDISIGTERLRGVLIPIYMSHIGSQALADMTTRVAGSDTALIAALHTKLFGADVSTTALIETGVWAGNKMRNGFKENNKQIFEIKQELRFCNRLMLDLTRKPIVSAVELTYNPDSEQGLRAFRGTLLFNEYPDGPVRVLMKLTEKDGRFVDVQQCGIMFTTPSIDVVQPPSLIGGQCRGRVDQDGRILLQTGTYEFKLTVTKDEESGDLILAGTVVDASAGGIAIGNVQLQEVIEITAFCRKWLRYGDQATAIESEETEAPALPTWEELGKSAEETERLYATVATTLKKAVTQFDIVLKDAVKKERSLKDTVVGASLMCALSPYTLEARDDLIAEAQKYCENDSGKPLMNPTANNVVSFLLGVDEEAFCDWINAQRLAGLPYGRLAAHNAAVIRAFVDDKAPFEAAVLVSDPWSTMTSWLREFASARNWELRDANSENSKAAAGNGIVWTGVTADNYRQVIALAQTTRSKALFATNAVAGSWADMFHVVNCTVTTECLTSSLQCENVASATETAPLEQQKQGLTKLSAARDTINHRIIDLRRLTGDQMSQVEASESKKDAYIAFGEAQVTQTIMDLEKARLGRNEAMQFMVPTPGAKRELEDLEPLARRVASLVMTTNRMLKQVRSVLEMPFTMPLQMAAAALKRSKKANNPVDVATKSYCESIMVGIPSGDRLPFAVCFAQECLVGSKLVDAADFSNLLAGFRSADIQAQREFEAKEYEAIDDAKKKASAKRDEQVQAQAAARKAAAGDKKAAATRPAPPAAISIDITLSPLVQPSYSFVTPEQWLRILVVHRTFPCYKGLPELFHDAENPKATAAREQKWKEWFAHPTMTIPNYEKDPAAHPLARFAMLLAVKPDKALPMLLQLYKEVLGSDAPDPINVTNAEKNLCVLDGQTQPSLPILLLSNTGGHSAHIRAMCSTGMQMRRDEMREDTKEKEKPQKGQPKKEAPVVQFYLRHASQPTDSLISVIETASANGWWVLIEDAHICSPQKIFDILRQIGRIPSNSTARIILSLHVASVLPHASASEAARTLLRTTAPRVAVASTQSVKHRLLSVYTEVVSDELMYQLRKCSGGPHVLFVANLLCAFVEERARLGRAGFVDSDRLHTSDTDPTVAIVAVLELLRGQTEVPWDELRDVMARVVAPSLREGFGAEVVRSYVDWLLHPELVGADLSIGDILRIPTEGTRQAHRLAVESLPISDFAELVGVSAVADSQLTANTGNVVLDTLEAVSGASAGSGNLNEAEQGRVDDTIRSLPKWTETQKTALLLQSRRDGISALSRAAHIEALRWADICTTINDTAVSQQAALALSYIPQEWRTLTRFNVRASREWLDLVCACDRHVREWLASTRSSVTLAFLHRPNAFFAAFVEDATVEAGQGAASLQAKLCYVATPTSSASPSDCSDCDSVELRQGVQIRGIRLGGAALDAQANITEVLPDALGSPSSGAFSPNSTVTSISPVQGVASSQYPPALTALTGVKLLAVPRNSPFTEDRLEDLDGATLQGKLRVIALSRRLPKFNFTRAITLSVKAAPALVRPNAALPPRPSSSQQRKQLPGRPQFTFFAPLYRSSALQPHDLIATVEVPTFQEHNHWALRGAVLCAE